ncbi:MAG: SUMF1/EgtB/PvdO family nonheme iron enzyme [Lentisphaeria bacterium]|nr:SUMF1/EgtB/PvdO family nonheme iron enzyme [Lentisphaeria bacterium]
MNSFTDQGGDNSSFKNCIFYNPSGYGAQSYSKCGSNGNIWADPLFTDPANGDFSLKAGSPCIDAGDGTVAPETDYWGRPRMDVVKVADSGKPNDDGVCPDIGIYEMSGSYTGVCANLTVSAITAPATARSGQEVSVSWTITNEGSSEAVAPWRDLVVLQGDDELGGQIVPLGEATVEGTIAPLASLEVTRRFTLPPMKPGNWKIGVTTNAYRDVYEVKRADNQTFAEDATAVTLPVWSSTNNKFTIGGYGETGFALPKSNSARIVTITPPSGAKISAYGADGYLPSSGNADVKSVTLSNGKVMLYLPAGTEETYVTLANESGASATVTVAVANATLSLLEATPVKILNRGTSTMHVIGTGLSAGSVFKLTLGSTTVTGQTLSLEDGLVAAVQFDVDGIVPGNYTLSVTEGGRTASLSNKITVTTDGVGPKLEAWLETPPSVRDNRIYTAWLCYKNSGDADMTMPIFEVTCSSSTKISYTVDGEYESRPLRYAGISPTAPAGVLKAGEENRMPVFFSLKGSYKLDFATISQNDTAHSTFGTWAEYAGAMAQAATRLNARGREEYRGTLIFEQAIKEKNGQPCSAISGHVRKQFTGEAIAGIIVSASSESYRAEARTDESGYFQLFGFGSGSVCVISVEGGYATDELSVTIPTNGDLNKLSVEIEPLCELSGWIIAEDTGLPLEDVTVSLYGAGMTVVQSTTDVDGYYRIIELQKGKYETSVSSAQGYYGDRDSIVIGDDGIYCEHNIYMSKGANVFGNLTRESDGVALEGVTVYLNGAGDSTQYIAVTLEDGTWSIDGIEHGLYHAFIVSQDYKLPEEVLLSISDEKNYFELKAVPQSIFYALNISGGSPLTSSFGISDPTVLNEVDATTLEWDFNGDGVVDSSEQYPHFTYTVPGIYDVSLRYVDKNGKVHVDVWQKCVTVTEKLEAKIQSNVLVLDDTSGFTVNSYDADHIVLCGTGSIVEGMVVIEKDGAFARKVISVEEKIGMIVLTTKEASLDDIFEQVDISELIQVTGEDLENAGFTRGGSSDNNGGNSDESFSNKYTLDTKLGISCEIEAGVKPEIEWKYEKRRPADAVVGGGGGGGSGSSWGEEGESNDGEGNGGGGGGAWGSSSSIMRCCLAIPMTLTATGKISRSASLSNTLEHELFRIKKGFFVYVGVLPIYLQLEIPVVIGVKATLSGSLSLTTSAGVKLVPRVGFELTDSDGVRPVHTFDGSFTYEPPKGKAEVKAEVKSYVNAGLVLKIYYINEISLTGGPYLKYTLSANTDAPYFDLRWGFEFDLAFSLLDFGKLGDSFFGVNKKWKNKNGSPYSEEEEKKGFHWNLPIKGNEWTIRRWKILKADFEYPKGKLEVNKLISFTDTSKKPQDMFTPKSWLWDFGDGYSSTEQHPSHAYIKDGVYYVALTIDGDGISHKSPCIKKIVVGDAEDDDDPPENYPGGGGGGGAAQSCDPNEISGMVGLGDAGTQRFVKPGEWLDYTVYFENKSTAAAPAQEVWVKHNLSKWLDWSTLELGEIAFNNQIQLELKGKARGTATVPQKDTNYHVQMNAAMDEATGEFTLYLRSYDKTRQAYGYWPESVYAGFLPPNDSTHRGEGHVTFRVKVKDNAPDGAFINAEAVIVFDANDPITTSPAWFNWVTTQESPVADNSTLRWDTSDDAAGTTYVVNYWSGDPDPTAPETTITFNSDTLTTGSWKIADGLAVGRWYWNVTKTNGDESSKTSTWSFDILAYHTLTVNGGIGGGMYRTNTRVTAEANTVEGKIFTGWTATGIELSEAELSEKRLVFYMPDNDVTLTANYEDKSIIEIVLLPGWNLVAAPGDLPQAGNEALFAELNPFVLDRGTKSYVHASLPLAAGTPLWIFSDSQRTIRFNHDDSGSVIGGLTGGDGWQLVGVAGRDDVVLNNVQAAWEWGHGRWNPLEINDGKVLLSAGRGYFIMAPDGTWDPNDNDPEMTTARYLVVDLSGGPDAMSYPVRYSETGPDLNDDTCRTTELWLRQIPAGTFTMGCDSTEVGYTGYEFAKHQVTITQMFYIGVFECTQKQWELVMGNNPSYYKGDCRPVESVSYNMIRGTGPQAGAGWPMYGHKVDATSFMGKLQEKTGLTFDLPTEAQWEYACRAGTTTALNSGKNLTSTSSDGAMNEVGRYYYNQSDGKGGYSSGHTKVGSYLPNAWGLYDMHGNVWEWTLDWWGANTSSTAAETDPVGPNTVSNRVLRGGSWGSDASFCRSANRNDDYPSNYYRYLGFRVLCLPLGR